MVDFGQRSALIKIYPYDIIVIFIGHEHQPMNIDNNIAIQELIETQAKTTPNNIAVIAGTKTLTYAELDNKSNQFAAHLVQQYNIKTKDIIAIHIQNSINQIIALVGILKARATYIPLDCAYPTARKSYMVQNAGACLVVSSTNSPLDIKGCPSLYIEKTWAIPALNPEALNLNYSLNDTLYILYTSGSTGQPKGVALAQVGVVNMLKWYCGDFAMHSTDINFVFSSFAYDLTQKNILSALISGATLVLHDGQEYSPFEIIQNIEKHQVSIINATPSAFYPLVDFAQNITQLASLRWIFLGGEKINCQRIQPIASLYPSTRVVNTYGPTECSDVACSYTLTAEDILTRRDIPLGKPIAGVGVFVLDEHLNIIHDTRQGEIYLFGHCVGNGYINQPQLSGERFLKTLPQHFLKENINCLYKVGDIGYWDSKGRLNFIGRVDDQIKLRGNRIELSEIDKVLETQDAIQQAVTVMVEDCDNQLLISFCLATKNLDPDLVKAEAGKFLPRHMLPNSLRTLDAFPLTPNAKVDKHALRKMACKKSVIPTYEKS